MLFGLSAAPRSRLANLTVGTGRLATDRPLARSVCNGAGRAASICAIHRCKSSALGEIAAKWQPSPAPSPPRRWRCCLRSRPALLRAQDLAAKAALCDACHGEQGIPADPMMPVIWGQHQPYLIRQIGEFKLGSRPNEPMRRLSATCRTRRWRRSPTISRRSPGPAQPASRLGGRGKRAAGGHRHRPVRGLPRHPGPGRRHQSAHRRPEPRLHAENLAGVPEQGARQQSLDVGHPRPAHADDLVALAAFMAGR